MLSLFKTIVGVVSLSGAQANPFVGANADRTTIERDDGSVAVKMNAVRQPFNKYDSLIDRTTSSKPPQSLYESTVETILGKSLEKVDFERSVTSFLDGSTAQHQQGKKRLGDGKVVTAVLDQTSYIWTAAVLMGRYTPMNVVFDTGSDWLVVEDTACEDCDGNKYDASQGEKVSDTLQDRAYGNVHVQGYEYSDTVCVQLSQCVSDFKYFAVSKQKGLREPIDGWLGLARNTENLYNFADVNYTSTTSYVTAMKEANLIEESRFSFYFNNKQSSYVDFGTHQTTSIQDEAHIKYIKTHDDFFWSMDCMAVGTLKSGDQINDMERKKLKSPVYTIIDSSSPTLTIASQYFDTLIEEIFSQTKGKPKYQIEQGQVLTECDAKYPSLFFMFGDSENNYWVEVKPDEYLLDVSEHHDESLCIFSINKNTEDFNIFGHPILQDYYTVFDNDEGKIGFAPHTASTKNELLAENVPRKKLSSSTTVRNAQLITWTILLVLIGGTFAAYYFWLFPWLHEKFPENEYKVVGISTGFWLVNAFLFAYVLRPIFINALSVSPRNGRIATPENEQTVNFVTFAYFAVSFWAYLRILKSLKEATKKEEAPAVLPERHEEIIKLLQEGQNRKLI